MARNKNISYWNNYYVLNNKKNKESNFAKFIKKKFLKKNDILLDVASGDGRDTFFFSKFAKYVYGIDKSKAVIKLNNIKIKKSNAKNIKFKDLSSEQIKYFKNKNISLIYARFFIHAITEKVEDKFFKDLSKYFKKNTKLALEFRTTKDNLIKKGKKISNNERITSHYRRFININNFEKKIKDNNFKIIYKKSGINMSKTKYENPHLARLIITQNV